MSLVKQKNPLNQVFLAIMMLGDLAVAYALLLYAYGGFFSRYMADDYCQSAGLAASRNVFSAVMAAYHSWLNSYSILFVVKLIDLGGGLAFKLIAAVTLAIWLACLAWLFVEIGKILQLPTDMRMCFWVAELTIFLSLYQAPALYQILYWRTGLIPYTLPLVFFVGNTAVLLHYARQPFKKSAAVLTGILFIGAIFFTGGLGETTGALQVGLLLLAVIIALFFRLHQYRRDIWMIVLIALLIAVLSMTIIALSPGTETRLNTIMTRQPLYNPIELSVQVLSYAYFFFREALRTAPLPNLVSIFIPAGILYVQNVQFPNSGQDFPFRRSALLVLVILLCVFIAVGFSFAPSAFVRTFPAARARFAAHFVLTLGLIMVGSVMGLYAAGMKSQRRTGIARVAVVFILGCMIFYPLNASSKIYSSQLEFRFYARAWDLRNELIRRSASDGVKNLTVAQLDTVGGVGEYKGDARHWINKCAAQFYGLDSIVAP